MLDRLALLPEPDLPDDAALLAKGRALARDWQVGPSAFWPHMGFPASWPTNRPQWLRAG